MGKNQNEIRAKMKAAFKGSVQTFAAIVLAVDEATMTIDVEPIGQAVINDVRIKAAIDEVTDGIVEFPKVDSSVLIGLIGNDENEAVLLKCSEVEKVVLFGGLNGGLINIQTLIEQLGKTNELITSITQVLSGSPITEAGNGAPSALQLALKTALTDKSLGNYTSMEDTKVTH